MGKTGIKRLEVVCTLKMLQFLLEDDQYFRKYPELHANIKAILLNRADIIFTDDVELLKQNPNPVYKGIWKDDGKTRIYQIEFEEEMFVDFNQALFLLDKSSEECAEIRETYNIACYCIDDILLSRHLFAHEKISVGSGSGAAVIKRESDFSRYKHHFNNVWIIDNYFPVTDYVENRFGTKNRTNPDATLRMIKELAYGAQESLLTVHIYTGEDIQNINKEWLANKFKGELKREVDLKFYKIPDNHDRNIITDYLWINSGVSLHSYRLDESKGLDLSRKFSTLSITGIANKSLSFAQNEDGPNGDFCWGIEGYYHIKNNIKNAEEIIIKN